MSDRKAKDGQLLGPRQASEFLTWRQARDKAIANPRRAKSVSGTKKAAQGARSRD